MENSEFSQLATYWYTDVDIDLLLKENITKYKDDLIIHHGISNDEKQMTKMVESVCNSLSLDKTKIGALIPINIGFKDKGLFSGIHWVSLVIIKNNIQKFQALYADSNGLPLCNTLPQLNQILEQFSIEIVFDSNIVQQMNDYDCGPWTVLNLYSLVRNKQLPSGISEISICEQRRILKKLRKSNLSQEEQQVLGITDIDINEEALQIMDSIPLTELIPDISDTCSIKQNDISKGNDQKLFQISFDHPLDETIKNARDFILDKYHIVNKDRNLSLEDDTIQFLKEIPKEKNVEKHKESERSGMDNKDQDLETLMKIYLNIERFQKEELDLQDLFITISDLTSGKSLSFNYKNGNCIRNKYGYIQRNNNNTINLLGIHFDKLYHMKYILTSTNNKVLSDLVNKSNILREDLINIKQVIRSILIEEKHIFPSNNEENNVYDFKDNYFMKNIKEFSDLHYNRMILTKIKYEVTNVEDIDFSNQNDRYYVARIFTIIGELMREYLEDNTDIGSIGARNVFGHLKNMRNMFVHYHNQIVNGINDVEKINILNENILSIFACLNELIEEGTLKKDYNYENIEKSISSLKTCLVISKQVSSSNDGFDDGQIINIAKKFKVDKILIEASKICQDNPKKINQILKHIDDKYQGRLKNVDKKIISRLPAALNIENREIIIQFSKQIEITERESSNTDKKDKYEKNEEMENKSHINTSNEKLKQKYKGEIVNLIIQASKIFTKDPKTNANESLKTLNDKYQKVIGQVDKIGHNSDYPKALDMGNREAITEYVNSLAKSKKPKLITKEKDEKQLLSSIEERLLELIRETKYLSICEDKRECNSRKYEYIIEHIVAIIGQIMREITDLNSQVKLLNTSLIHDYASRSAKAARNQNLTHDIFSFDKESLAREILTNILPANNHFKALLTISKRNSSKLTKGMLFSIALSFLKLGLYDNAAIYFQKTIDYGDEKHKEFKDSTVETFINVFNLNIFFHFDNYFLTDFYSSLSRLFLMYTYIVACKYEESYHHLVILKNTINIEKIMNSDEKILKSLVNDVYNGLAYCLLIEGKNIEVIKLMKEIIPISDYPFFKVHLASAYHYENKPVDAYTLLKTVFPFDFEPIMKYKAYHIYIRVLAYQPNRRSLMEESARCIREMEKIFKDNYRLFKETYDDTFLIMQALTIRLKVQLIVEKVAPDQSGHPNISEKSYRVFLKKLEKYVQQFNDLIREIKHDLANDVRMPGMYFWICRAYSTLITDKISDINYEKTKLIKAQYHFDKARIKFDYFQTCGRLSVANIKEMIKTADILAYGYNKFASRLDQDESSRNFYIQKGSPYSAMVARYMARYQSMRNQV